MRKSKFLWRKLFGYSVGDEIRLLKDKRYCIWTGNYKVVNEWVQFPRGSIAVIEDILEGKVFLICLKTPKEKKGWKTFIGEEEMEHYEEENEEN